MYNILCDLCRLVNISLFSEMDMKIDLTPILSGEVKELPFSFTENAAGEMSDIYFKGLDIIPRGDITVKGKICDISGYYELKSTVCMPYSTHCARCGKQIDLICECGVARTVSQQADSESDDDEIIFCTDRQIELDIPVYEELSISFPSKPLCRQDCRGLCPVCGQDLNEGGCEHSENNKEKDTL